MAVCAALVLALTAAMLPVSSHRLGPTVSFVPAMLAVVACFDILSMYLLIGEYRDTGDLRLLAMSWAYLWSLVTMGAYALSFPGVVSAHPPLAITPSMAPWFYVAWHCGFPVLLGAAWAPWPRSWEQVHPASRRRTTTLASVAMATWVPLTTVAALAAAARHLPILIRGLNTWPMTAVTAPIALPLTAASVLSATLGTRSRRGPERWSCIAALVCLCDLVLTYLSHYRYSLGWYTGRCLTLVAAGTVFIAMLASFRRLKAHAEREAAIDSLTGLANRRSAHQALSQLAARAQRAALPLGIVAFDLDHFKSVNDRHGHDAGDRVLAAVGDHLHRVLRLGDIAARVGGEEFLVLLPDTDTAGARTVAEKIRVGLSDLRIPGLEAITVSLGAGALSEADDTPLDALRRVDEALYEAKRQGRNRTVDAPPAPSDRALVSA